MLTLENVLEIESQELSINRSALLLNVRPCVLSKFINDNKIFWRGKGIAFAKSVGNGIRQSTSKKLIRGADQATVKQLALAYANNKKSVNVSKVSVDADVDVISVALEMAADEFSAVVADESVEVAELH